jgi:hypothetical protein
MMVGRCVSCVSELIAAFCDRAPASRTISQSSSWRRDWNWFEALRWHIKVEDKADVMADWAISERRVPASRMRMPTIAAQNGTAIAKYRG